MTSAPSLEAQRTPASITGPSERPFALPCTPGSGRDSLGSSHGETRARGNRRLSVILIRSHNTVPACDLLSSHCKNPGARRRPSQDPPFSEGPGQGADLSPSSRPPHTCCVTSGRSCLSESVLRAQNTRR